eukprot:1352881-Amorphochlora_amoeboformis.AAC.3
MALAISFVANVVLAAVMIGLLLTSSTHGIVGAPVSISRSPVTSARIGARLDRFSTINRPEMCVWAEDGSAPVESEPQSGQQRRGRRERDGGRQPKFEERVLQVE